MFLLFDLSKRNAVQLALFDYTTIEKQTYEGSNSDLLFFIDKFLSEQGLSIQNVQGVMAVVGEGGFTSTRIATTVANTFGFVLKIPLLAITTDKVGNIQRLISELLDQPKGQYISAKYSAEPNIT